MSLFRSVVGEVPEPRQKIQPSACLKFCAMYQKASRADLNCTIGSAMIVVTLALLHIVSKKKSHRSLPGRCLDGLDLHHSSIIG